MFYLGLRMDDLIATYHGLGLMDTFGIAASTCITITIIEVLWRCIRDTPPPRLGGGGPGERIFAGLGHCFNI